MTHWEAQINASEVSEQSFLLVKQAYLSLVYHIQRALCLRVVDPSLYLNKSLKVNVFIIVVGDIPVDMINR